jgi:GT2 family glycosyltransferase
LSSLKESSLTPLQIFVVDGGAGFSTQISDFEEVRSAFPEIKVIITDGLLAGARNKGVQLATTEFVFFLDDDNVVEKETLSELVSAFSSREICEVAPVAYYFKNPNEIWTSVIEKGSLPVQYVRKTLALDSDTLSFVVHNAFMVRRDVFNEIGGFDQQGFPIHFSELDFSYRMHRAGYIAVVCPKAKVYHDVAPSNLNVDPVRAYYTLRNREILAKRYLNGRDRAVFYCGVLPAMTLYYLYLYTRFAKTRRKALTNLLRGIIAGFRYKDAK